MFCMFFILLRSNTRAVMSLLLGQRRRRLANISPELAQSIGYDLYSINSKQHINLNIDQMLAHRLRRWVNVTPTLGSHIC